MMKSKESSSCQQVETKMAAGYFGKVLRHDKFVNYLGFGLELRQGCKSQGYTMGVLLSTSFYIL